MAKKIQAKGEGEGTETPYRFTPGNLEEIHHVVREDHHYFVRFLQRLRQSRGRLREGHSPDREEAFRTAAEALLRFLFLRLGEEGNHEEIRRLLLAWQTPAERSDLLHRMDLHLQGDEAGREAWRSFFSAYDRMVASSETVRSMVTEKLPIFLGQVADRVDRIQRGRTAPLFVFDNSGRGICVLRSQLLARGFILISVSGMVDPAGILLEFRHLNRRLEVARDLPSPRLIGARILRANLLVGDHDIGLHVLAKDAEALGDLALFIQRNFAEATSGRHLPPIQMSTKSYVLSRYYFYRDYQWEEDIEE